MKNNGGKAALVIDGSYISFEDILAVAKDGIPVSISKSKAFVKRMAQTQTALMDAMQKGVAVYGVNTGYGKSCGNRISMKTALKNGANIFRFHGCGTGDPIGIEETRAAMLTRIICLARGYSGVSIGLLQQMAEFLKCRDHARCARRRLGRRLRRFDAHVLYRRGAGGRTRCILSKTTSCRL